MDEPVANDSEISKHILALSMDVLEYSHHRKEDKTIRSLIRDPSNARLMYPETRSDYFDLAMLVLNNYLAVNTPWRGKTCSELVKEHYVGEEVSEEVFIDFKKMVDICLEYGRFRYIRILGELYI